MLSCWVQKSFITSGLGLQFWLYKHVHVFSIAEPVAGRCMWITRRFRKFKINSSMSSADNLCKQFWSRSGRTKCRACSGSKLFDALMVLLKEKILKMIIMKKQLTAKNHEKIPIMPSVNNSLKRQWLAGDFWTKSAHLFSRYMSEPWCEKTWLCWMQIRKALIRLPICTVWSMPLLFSIEKV